MHLPGIHREHTLTGRTVRLGCRRAKLVRRNLRWRTLGVKLRLLVQLLLRRLKKSIVIEISAYGQAKRCCHYHLPLPFVYPFPFLSAWSCMLLSVYSFMCATWSCNISCRVQPDDRCDLSNEVSVFQFPLGNDDECGKAQLYAGEFSTSFSILIHIWPENFQGSPSSHRWRISYAGQNSKLTNANWPPEKPKKINVRPSFKCKVGRW